MIYYFKLQYRLINRLLQELGIYPLLGWLGATGIFLLFSHLIFVKLPYPEYCYLLFSVSLVIRLGKKDRTEFLKMCFSRRNYFKLRLLENVICVLPSLLFLLFMDKYLSVLLLGVISLLLVFFTYQPKSGLTIPTPFYRNPFEFIMGFRTYYVLILLLYVLTIIAIAVQNINLGLFALIVLHVIIVSFYYLPEEKYFVWIFNLSPQQFLYKKIKTGVWYTLLLCAPVSISLFIFNPTKFAMLSIAGVQLLGIFMIIIGILGKYSVFPSLVNIALILCIYFSVALPPLMIIVIPLLYFQSTNRLKGILA